MYCRHQWVEWEIWFLQLVVAQTGVIFQQNNSIITFTSTFTHTHSPTTDVLSSKEAALCIICDLTTFTRICLTFLCQSIDSQESYYTFIARVGFHFAELRHLISVEGFVCFNTIEWYYFRIVIFFFLAKPAIGYHTHLQRLVKSRG